MRHFDTGAIRDTDNGKLDFEGFLSPVVLKRYAEFMHKNRQQVDGSLRDSDNWQKGIPTDVYMKSLIRHTMSMWENHRQGKVDEDEVCAVMFNAMGYLFETIRSSNDW